MAHPGDAGGGRQGQIREYNIRMASSFDMQREKMFIGNFPLGIPNFRDKNERQWDMYKDKAESTSKLKDAGEAPWLLEDRPGHVSHRGVQAKPTAMSGYFVLTRMGDEFIAHPIPEWYNFRPVVQHEVLPLEEAEELMKKKQKPRISRAVSERLRHIAQKQEPSESQEDGTQRLGLDSDDSMSDGAEKRRKRPLQASELQGDHQLSDSEPEVLSDDKDGEKLRPANVEDWEFEEDVDDDDVNMGELDADDEEAEQEYRRFVGSDSDDDAEDLNESGKMLKKLLRKTGLDESDSEGEAEDAYEGGKASKKAAKKSGSEDTSSERDNAMDVDAEQSPTRSSQEKAKLPKKLGQKRKAGAPESGASIVPSDPRSKPKIARSGQAADDPKPVEKKPTLSREDQAKQQSEGGAGKKSSTGHEHTHNPFLAPVADFLRQHGAVPLHQLTQEFKKLIKSKDDKEKFIQGVRRVAVWTADANDPSNKILRLKP